MLCELQVKQSWIVEIILWSLLGVLVRTSLFSVNTSRMIKTNDSFIHLEYGLLNQVDAEEKISVSTREQYNLEKYILNESTKKHHTL